MYADTLITGQQRATSETSPAVAPVAAASPPPDSHHSEPNVIILKPEERVVSVDYSIKKDLIKEALKSVPVTRVDFKQSGAVVLNFPSKKDRQNGKSALQDCVTSHPDLGFVLKEPQKILPKLTITNIPTYLNDDEIITEILNKNEKVDQLVKDGCSLSLCFTRNKNSDSVSSSRFAVLKVDPKIREVCLDSGFIFLDFSRCKVYDRFWVTQCYHCQRFGHLTSACHKKRDAVPPTCKYCAGSHNSSECSNKESPKCANCKNNKDSLNSDHFSFNETCPIFMSHKQKLIDATVTVSTHSKN